MTARTHELNFNGGLLQRGFRLYVWEITTPQDTQLYYVGRTGDSSSIKAQSPFNRMGQHLGFRKQNNALRRRLAEKEIDPEGCSFRLVSYGPILKEGATAEEHRERRDSVAPLEKALAVALTAAGYEVMNPVNCRIKLDTEKFATIEVAFAAHFHRLRRGSVEADGSL